jgi:hypothetical protein
MHLDPECAYSFSVAAVNGVGQSDWSELGSAETPPVKTFTLSPAAEAVKAALACREAWVAETGRRHVQ